MEHTPSGGSIRVEVSAASGRVRVDVCDSGPGVPPEARADIFPPGHTRRTIFPDLVRSLRATIVELGLMGEAELDELDRAVRAHLDDPDVLVLPHLYFLVWGRRP